MRELHAIHREIVADKARAAFHEALRAMQREMPRVKKNGTVSLVKDGVTRGYIPLCDMGGHRHDRSRVGRYGFSVTFSEVASDANGSSAPRRAPRGPRRTELYHFACGCGDMGRNPLQARRLNPVPMRSGI